MKTILAAIVVATSMSVTAEAGHRRYSHVYRDEVCTKTIYEEVYRPPRSLGNPSPRGQIFSESYDVEVPCKRRRYYDSYPRPEPTPDTNDCSEGTVIGGLLGGLGAAAISENDALIWSIPLGVVGGAMTGCQIDGG